MEACLASETGQDQAAGSDALISEEEALAGFSARRARRLLFLIESRTAHLAARSSEAEDLFGGEQAGRERDLAYFDAFVLGRDPPKRPTIQDIERYAPEWRELLPDNVTVRAATARFLGEKYRFTRRQGQNIRGALALDEAAVQAAFARLYTRPLETIYAPQLKLGDELRWRWSALGKWLFSLPPLWFAFIFTVSLGIPQALLVVPIAVASLGPLPGVAITIAAALVSVVTVAGLAEAAARSGVVRYGSAYVGRLALDYLGVPGSLVFSLASLGGGLLTLLAGLLAIPRTLLHLTTVPAPFWSAVLFAAALLLVARGSLTLSVVLLVSLAGLIAVLLVIVGGLSLGHFDPDRLTYVAGIPGDSGAAHFGDAVGVILMSFFLEALIVQCAKAVLPRDPSGRALVSGSLMGLGAVTVTLCVWIVVVTGSVAPGLLAGQKGTIIEPLRAEIGPVVLAFGTLLVLLLTGLAALRGLLLAAGIVREWLPARPNTVLSLPRGRGQLVARPRLERPGDPALGLAYLGAAGGAARFRLDVQLGAGAYTEDIGVTGRWDTSSLFQRLPELRRRGLGLTVNVLDASPDFTRLQIASFAAISYQGEWTEDLAGVLGQPRDSNAAPSRRGPIASLGDRARFLITVSPIAAVFIAAEWLLVTGTDSFSGVIGVAGVLTSSVFAGVIPALLIVASRKKGEVIPGLVLKFVGHPLVVGGVFTLYIVILIAHGVFIWEQPLGRVAALTAAVGCLIATYFMIRGGAFTPHLVVELREDLRRGASSGFGIVAAGAAAVAAVRLAYPGGERTIEASSGEVPEFASLRSATFELPPTTARVLKVWAHRVTPDGSSEGLPALLEVETGAVKLDVDMRLSAGRVSLPLGPGPGPGRVKISMQEVLNE